MENYNTKNQSPLSNNVSGLKHALSLTSNSNCLQNKNSLKLS